MSLSDTSGITDSYTYIYNRVLSALMDDGVIEDVLRIQFARKITDAIWALHLSVNDHEVNRSSYYNNFSNTKSMVNSIVSSINTNNK